MSNRVRMGLGILLFTLRVAAATAEEPAPRTLLIALDAVPFWVVDEVTDPQLGLQAAFQGFQGPVQLVSTFPSSTSVAMVGILHPLGLEKSPGYEARFFDWQRLKTRGGGMISYSKIEFPWRDFFDWNRRDPVGSAVEAVRPVKSGTKRLRKAIDAFVASEADVTLIYIAATDIAVHVVGPDSVKQLLVDLDKMLQDARAKRPERPFETVIFSDHGVAGGEPLINVSKATKKALKAAGYQTRKKLAKPGTVVMTPFGLVSNFEAYTYPELKLDVAAVLAGVAGVDLCVVATGESSWQVLAANGSATFALDTSGAQPRWHYASEGEDPLGYGALIARLGPTAVDPDGWVEDGDLFESTWDQPFPDALHRMADAFELVTNPASVVCSTGSGYMYGAPSTSALARVGGKGKLRWTHGALSRAAATGFLLSDVAGWQPPEALRYDRALLPFAQLLSRHPHVSLPAAPPPGE